LKGTITMTKRLIKAYTLVRSYGDSQYRIFAITSEGGRRVNGHYVGAEYGSHVTHNMTVGRYLELKDAEAKVASVKAAYDKHKPFVQAAYNEYVALDRAMNDAIQAAAKPEILP